MGQIIVAVVMAAGGVLLIWQGWAAASGRLKRNAVAGIRTASTMASDEAWLAAHRRAKTPTVVAGAVSIAAALVVLLPVPSGVFVAAVLVSAVLDVVLVLWGAAVGVRAARALAADG